MAHGGVPRPPPPNALATRQHPEYEEQPPPDWLVGVPDPGLADQWEMLSFYRFVQIDHPEAFANMLQVWYRLARPGGSRRTPAWRRS